jgi:hypothetical protein
LGFPYPLSRSAQKRNKKKSVRGKNLDPRPRKTFVIAFLGFPYREALNQRNKKVERNRSQNNPPPKKYVPGEIFRNALSFVSRVFELPLARNAQKRTNKKQTKKGTSFCELAQMYVVFPVFFSAAPWHIQHIVTCQLLPADEPAHPASFVGHPDLVRVAHRLC